MLFLCLFLLSSDWLAVLAIFRGITRLGWEVAPHSMETQARLEHGKLADTSEAAARQKI